MNRITRFLTTPIERSQFAALASEFASEAAVEGEHISLDPKGETEAFAQGRVHDIVLPEIPKRLIELFAQEHADDLLPDEWPILEAYLHDRPSLYQVIEFLNDPKDTYRVQDLLSPDDLIPIKDRATSQTLRKGSIFMGRALPLDRQNRHYPLLGSITELPAPLWIRLSSVITGWKAESLGKLPEATTVAFYRSRPARLVRKIAELTHGRPALH